MTGTVCTPEYVELREHLTPNFLKPWHIYDFYLPTYLYTSLPSTFKYLPSYSVTFSQNGLIYNRVGKCGSRSVLKIIEAIAAHNNFKLIGVHENLNRKLTLAQQVRLATDTKEQ